MRDGIDARELRPCDACGGTIVPAFYVIEVAQALVDADAANAFMGTLMQLGGSMALARAMAPNSTLAKTLPPTRLLVCQECAFAKLTDLAVLVEQRQAAEARDEVESAAGGGR